MIIGCNSQGKGDFDEYRVEPVNDDFVFKRILFFRSSII